MIWFSLKGGRALRSENPWGLETRQRRDIHVAEGAQRHRAGGLDALDKPGDAAFAPRRDQLAAFGELRCQRVGKLFDRAVDQDAVDGRFAGSASGQRTLDPANRRIVGCGAGGGEQIGLLLDRDDRGTERREQRGGVARRRTDEQHALARPDIGGDQQAAGDERRIERAAVTQRDRAVHIGDARQRRGNMRLARHAAHRRDDRRVDHVIGPQLAVDHRSPHVRSSHFVQFRRHQPVFRFWGPEAWGRSSRTDAVLQY